MKKKHVTYRGTKMTSTTSSPTETMEARRYWNGISKMLRGRKYPFTKNSTISKTTSPFPKCGLSIRTFSQRVWYGGGGKRVPLKKPDKPPQIGGPGPQQAANHVDIIYSWCNMRVILYHCLLPPSLIMKIHQSNPDKGTFYKVLDESSSKLSRQLKLRKGWEINRAKRSLEPRQLNVMWCPRWGAETKKKRRRRRDEN